MAAVSRWYATFGYATDEDASMSLNLGNIHWIVRGAWTVVIVLYEMSMIFGVATKVYYQHEEILDKMDKIGFVQTTKMYARGTTEAAPQQGAIDIRQDHLVKVIHMLRKSDRPRGFCAGRLVDINPQAILLLIVCVVGYVTFVIDRTDNAQERRSYAAGAIRLNLSHCRPDTIVYPNISCAHALS
ncbi:uncharacterized protein LOC129594141 [Paramacrobiotus metropolitanus]|uniref:uncharacterized protein LOC129594141 n=1 Tax=Paramacrobiotus metropolitanus TaxID=2943436 RepID=UPI0024456092|nr:uncharacterized protein LOC129594141 [Paramacrobiotus metropolitanus]